MQEQQVQNAADGNPERCSLNSGHEDRSAPDTRRRTCVAMSVREYLVDLLRIVGDVRSRSQFQTWNSEERAPAFVTRPPLSSSLQHIDQHHYRRRKNHLRPNADSPAELAVGVHLLVKGGAGLACFVTWSISSTLPHPRIYPDDAVQGYVRSWAKTGSHRRTVKTTLTRPNADIRSKARWLPQLLSSASIGKTTSNIVP